MAQASTALIATPGSAARQLALLLAGVLIVLLLRSLWTFPVTDHDAITKYYYAAEIARSGDWSLLLQSHHTMRWVEMLPQIALTALMGPRYELFYALPLATFALYFVLLLALLRRHLAWHWLLLAACLLFVEPLSFRVSSQLLNPPFGILFALLGTWLLSRHVPTSAPAAGLAALSFFCAWGAHETYLAFSAGAGLWLLCGRQWRAACVFAGTLAGLLVVEALIFNALGGPGQDLHLGRVERLAQLPQVRDVAQSLNMYTISTLLRRWFYLPFFDFGLFLAFLAAVFFWLRRPALRQAAPPFISCLLAVTAGFGIILTLAVYDLRTLVPVVPLRPRYLTPFFSLSIGFTIWVLAKHWQASLHWQRLLACGTAAVLTGVLLLAPGLLNTPGDSLVIIRREAFVWQAQRQYLALAEQFAAGEMGIGGRYPSSTSLIFRFARPVSVVREAGTIRAAGPGQPPRCVTRLDRAPLDSNFGDCPR